MTLSRFRFHDPGIESATSEIKFLVRKDLYRRSSQITCLSKFLGLLYPGLSQPELTPAFLTPSSQLIQILRHHDHGRRSTQERLGLHQDSDPSAGRFCVGEGFVADRRCWGVSQRIVQLCLARQCRD